jgi:hypothetical protein
MNASPVERETAQSRSAKPIVIVDGRIGEIEARLSPADAVQHELVENADGGSFVKLVFFDGAQCYFLMINDHRKQSIEAYREGGMEALISVFYNTSANGGTAGRIAKRKGQYMAIADFNDPLNTLEDVVQDIVLTRTKIDRVKLRVIVTSRGEALHPATGICFCERREAPSEK